MKHTLHHVPLHHVHHGNHTFLLGWILQLIRHQAYLGSSVFLGIEEMGFPLPIPGDVIVAYTGYLVSIGALSYPIAFLLLLVAILIGASILFYLSLKFGQKIVLTLGAYINLDEKKLVLVESKFKKYGAWVIIIGRHLPGFRVPITVFAGMSGVSYKTFIASTFISVFFWIAFYLWLGQKLGKKTVHLLHAHHGFYLLFAIPFLIGFSGFAITYIRRNFSAKNRSHKGKYKNRG